MAAVSRTLMAITMVDLDGLRFLSSAAFTKVGNEYTTTTGTVSIGYIPAATEKYLPLIEAELTQLGSSQFIVNDDPGTGTFSVRASTLDLVVVGGAPSVPIPIWQPNGTFLLNVEISQLVGAGFPIPSDFTKPFTVASIDFALSKILFANPNGGDTTLSQVKMQGTASFDKTI